MPEKLWERKQGEPVAAYHAFSMYRDLGPGRTFSSVFQQLCIEKSMEGQHTSNGQPPSVIVIHEGDPPNPNQAQKKKIADTVKQYSTKWRWYDRCTAWDAFINLQVQQRNAVNYDKLRDKQIKVAAVADAVNVLLMSELLRRMQSAEGRAGLQGIETKELLKLAVDSASRVKAIQEAERSANGVISKASTQQGGIFRWIITEFQPERQPEEIFEAAEEIMNHNPMSFPEQGTDPLDPFPTKTGKP